MSSKPSERSLISLERRCLCGVFIEAAITMDPWPDSNGRITSSLVTVKVHNLGVHEVGTHTYLRCDIIFNIVCPVPIFWVFNEFLKDQAGK